MNFNFLSAEGAVVCTPEPAAEAFTRLIVWNIGVAAAVAATGAGAGEGAGTGAGEGAGAGAGVAAAEPPRMASSVFKYAGSSADIPYKHVSLASFIPCRGLNLSDSTVLDAWSYGESLTPDSSS